MCNSTEFLVNFVQDELVNEELDVIFRKENISNSKID